MPPRRPRGASHSGLIEFDVTFEDFAQDFPQEPRRGGGRRQRANTDFTDGFCVGRRSSSNSFSGWPEEFPFPYPGALAAMGAMPPYGAYPWHPFMPPTPAYTGYPFTGLTAAAEWGMQMYLLGKGAKGRGRGRGGGGGGHMGDHERERSASKTRRSRAATATSASPERIIERSEEGPAAKPAKKAVIVPGDIMTLPAPVKVHVQRPPPVDGTTVMLRNIPNRYQQKSLLALLDETGFNKAYDFVYLPMDFRNGVNLGYAFVNLVNHDEAKKLMQKIEGWKEWDYDSSKVCEVSWAHPHQGLEQHVERYRNSPVMHVNMPDAYKPMVFKDGERAPFPAPTKAIRAPKFRPFHDRAASAATAQER